MGLLSKMFGYRWSLYFSNSNKEIYYAMHCDSVIGLLHQVSQHFIEFGDTKSNRKIYLNFNKSNQNFELKKKYFDHLILSNELFEIIKTIDTLFQKYPPLKDVAPQFIDLINNKTIKIFSVSESFNDPTGFAMNIIQVNKVIDTFFKVNR